MLSFPYPFGLRRKYPGLQPEDRKVWERFISQYPNYYTACDYNVRVGQGNYANKQDTENIQRMTKLNSKLKIDVIATKDSDIHIIELKPYFMPSAIGQLQVYKFCFEEETNFIFNPQLVCICYYIQTDAARYALENDILILTVQPALMT